jgi:nucleotide-binding universal stress UspA family protein
MSAVLGPARIRRILIALDASAKSLAALEQAAALAARLDAELLGLFVEDVNLLRLARLPFTREIGLWSALSRRLEDTDMQRALRGEARRAQQAFDAVAERLHVQCSFRVVRGRVVTEVLEAARTADLVTIALTRGAVFGTTTRALVAGAPSPVLLLQQGAGIRPPVAAVYDGTVAADHALDVGRQLALALGAEELVILIAEREAERLARLQQELRERIEGSGLAARVRQVNPDAASLLRAALAEDAGTLVLTIRHEATLVQLLAGTDCAVLLVP